ncbi:MAG: hypothetical protein ACFFB5_15050 [Promethearchaeota archaeon]
MSNNKQNEVDLDDKIFEYLVSAVKERLQTRLSFTHYLFTLSIGMVYFAWRADLGFYTIIFLLITIVWLIVIMYIRSNHDEITGNFYLFKSHFPLDKNGKKQSYLEHLKIKASEWRKLKNKELLVEFVLNKEKWCNRAYFTGESLFLIFFLFFTISLIFKLNGI